MSKIIEFISKPEVYTPLIGIAGAIIGSWVTFILGIKRFTEEKIFQNKLDRYLVIVDTCKGWVEGSDPEMSPNDRSKFANSYRTIWLYGSAQVVKELSKFLKIMTNPPKKSKKLNQIKNKAKIILKQSIIEMRKDLKAKGNLKESDFDIFI